MKKPVALLMTLAALAGAASLRAQAAPKRVAVPRVASPPGIDGRLDDAAWSGAARLEDWKQIKPGDNASPIGRTVAYLAHDDDALYLAIRAEEAAGAVRYAVHPRDAVTRQGQDWIEILLDTFNDRRRAFAFAVNPIGVQGDAIVLEGGSAMEWDAVYESAGAVDPDRGGYTIEVRIPLRSLRFSPRPAQHWGISLRRTYGASGAEDTAWPRDRDLGCNLCQMGELVLDGVEPGRNVELNPTMMVRREAARSGGEAALGEFGGTMEPGVGLKYGLTPDLTLDATLNPDFSQVESDAGQLEVNNRFALFFPEKRPFFLEGGDLFAAGFAIPGGGPSAHTPLDLFYSRTVVEPDWGIKLSGKQGRVGLGLLAARDAAPPLDLEAAAGGSTVAVGRARVDVLADGHVGTLLTARRHHESDDVVGAVDARLRFGDNTVLRAIAAASRVESAAEEGREPLQGEAVHVQLDYQSRRWIGGLAVADITPDFRAPLGFIRRTDQILFAGTWGYVWQGEGLVQRIRPELHYQRIHAHGPGAGLFAAGRLVDELYESTLTVHLARATALGIAYDRARTYFGDREFPALDRARGFINSQAISWLGLDGSVSAGEEVIYADRVQGDTARSGWFVQGGLTATIRPAPALRIDLNAQASRVWRTGERAARESRYADALIPRLHAEYQATRRLGLRGIAEWRRQSFYAAAGQLAERDERLSGELLASYIIDAGSAIYLGWTELQDGAEARPLSTARRGGVAKVSYLWRL